jgi:probable rRNA maturation factor
VSSTLIIHNASGSRLPPRRHMQQWVDAALRAAKRRRASEIHVRFTGESEMTELNTQYRGKVGATNVLSFPAEIPDELRSPLLGDIAVCVPIMQREARLQRKSIAAHCAHLLVHGTLHLLGYDHEQDTDAARMEALESTVLRALNFPCPYQLHQH